MSKRFMKMADILEQIKAMPKIEKKEAKVEEAIEMKDEAPIEEKPKKKKKKEDSAE